MSCPGCEGYESSWSLVKTWDKRVLKLGIKSWREAAACSSLWTTPSMLRKMWFKIARLSHWTLISMISIPPTERSPAQNTKVPSRFWTKEARYRSANWKTFTRMSSSSVTSTSARSRPPWTSHLLSSLVRIYSLCRKIQNTSKILTKRPSENKGQQTKIYIKSSRSLKASLRFKVKYRTY